MGKRRKARESTLQILFQLEFDIAQTWKDSKRLLEEQESSQRDKRI